MRDRFGWEGDTLQPAILTIPGLNNSGPDHWQTRWETLRGDCSRVELGDWDNPRRELWINRLDGAIRAAGGPIILVAHSLGAVTVAWWAARFAQPYGWPVAAALLVAPADCDRTHNIPSLDDFGPVPREALPFPSYLVASRNDPYIRFDRAHNLGKYWGSQVIDAGECGHINVESGLGDWPLGQKLLDQLIGTAVDQAGLRRQLRPARAGGVGELVRGASGVPAR